MAFRPGESGNPAGRPKGAVSRATLPVRTQKLVIKQLESRAREGDRVAVDTLAELMLRQPGQHEARPDRKTQP